MVGIWLGLALLLTVAWLRRASVIPVAITILYLGIPFAAGSTFTGGLGHPATIVAVIALVVATLVRPRAVFGELGAHPLLYAAVAGLLVFLGVALRLGSDGATIPIDTMLAPFLVLLLIRVSSSWGPVHIALRNAIILVAVAQVIVSAVTWITGAPFLFVEEFSRYYWFTPEYARGMGTTDHPLVLSMLLAATVPLLTTVRPVILRLGILVVLILGLLLTESRTGLIAAIVGTAFLVLSRGNSVGVRIIVFLGAAVAGFFVLQGPVATGVLDKFGNDGGSASVRGDAAAAFFQRWGEFLVLGWGPQGAETFKIQEGLRSSLESAFLIYAVNYGILFTVSYFLVAIAFTFSSRSSPAGSRLAAITALAVAQTFSSLATLSASAEILWILVALAALDTNSDRRAQSLAAQGNKPAEDLTSPSFIANTARVPRSNRS